MIGGMTGSPDDLTSTRLYEALGGLVVRFAWLEDNLHDAIYMALHPADMTQINVLTAGLQFRTLVEKLGALLRDHPLRKAAPEEIEAFCSHLLTLNEQRNTFIHSVYGRTPEGVRKAYKRTARPKAGFSLNVRDLSVADIDALTASIDAAEKRLWQLAT
jgi:hypothetical protein